MKRTLLVVAIMLASIFAAQTVPVEATHGGRIPHCGDYCDVEGAGGGCVYYRNGVLTRTTATCQNGRWTPSL